MDAAPLDYETFKSKCNLCPHAECPTFWVFGYGSLMYNPGLKYKSCRVGYVKNYERSFNQGNETFRGTKGKPGRVANLEERQGGKVWGVAYEICGKDEVEEVLKYLYHREISQGSYTVTMTTFHPRRSTRCLDTNMKCCSKNYHNIPLPHPPCGLSNSIKNQTPKSCCLSKLIQNSTTKETPSPALLSLSWLETYPFSCQRYDELKNECPCMKLNENISHDDESPIQALLFTVTTDNSLYLGSDDVDRMATQIIEANGKAGTNVEYVIRISDFIKTYIPEDDDKNLFHLDRKIMEQLETLESNVLRANS